MKRYDDIEQELHELSKEIKLSSDEKSELLIQINEKIDHPRRQNKWPAMIVTAVATVLFAIMIPLLSQTGLGPGNESETKPIAPDTFTTFGTGPAFEFKLPSYMPEVVISASGEIHFSTDIREHLNAYLHTIITK